MSGARERSAVVYLGLGSNLGDRAARIAGVGAALEEQRALRPLRTSSLYETEPLAPAGSAADPIPWYLNAVIEGETSLAPEALLDAVQGCERRLGRRPGRARWAPREIDIDILLFADLRHRSRALTIPHPGLIRRRFVLLPLAELCPERIVPGTGRSVRDHLTALSDPLRVLPYGSP